MKNEVKDIKFEHKGFFSPKTRVTSQTSEGKIGVSDWKSQGSDATQQARERAGSSRNKK